MPGSKQGDRRRRQSKRSHFQVMLAELTGEVELGEVSGVVHLTMALVVTAIARRGRIDAERFQSNLTHGGHGRVCPNQIQLKGKNIMPVPMKDHPRKKLVSRGYVLIRPIAM